MLLSLWYHNNIHWQIAMALSQLAVPWFSLRHSIKLISSPVQLTFISLAGRLSSPNNPPPRPIAPGSVKWPSYLLCESIALRMIIDRKSKLFSYKFILKSDNLENSYGKMKQFLQTHRRGRTLVDCRQLMHLDCPRDLHRLWYTLLQYKFELCPD